MSISAQKNRSKVTFWLFLCVIFNLLFGHRVRFGTPLPGAHDGRRPGGVRGPSRGHLEGDRTARDEVAAPLRDGATEATAKDENANGEQRVRETGTRVNAACEM